MARKYSGAKGKSGSKKPVNKVTPSWINYKPKEIEKLVIKLAKAGKPASQIGMHLRDTYGVPSVKIATKKTISEILKENKLEKQIPEDLMALIKKSIYLRKHLEKNKKDMASKRGLELTDSKIRRLAKYYIRKGRLPEDWKFHPDRIKLSVE
ncbi:30S ribosomal protein S15 [Candidatus Woesearchaeota archaeon]|nr:30S ribosomal protein S15 [Candidatus Woesearchaeota archaeon]